jgi:arsenate reductase
VALPDYFDLPIECYSDGVEVSEFNPRAVDASVKDGFLISKNDFSNPLYSIKTALEARTYFAFPKYYDDLSNPHSGFAVLVTCDHADGNCPVISGADICIPPHWEDPKIFNGTS